MLKNKTLRTLLEDPRIADIAPHAICRWDLSREEFYDWTLQEIADRKGWRNLERGFTRLFDAADRGDYFYRLYSDAECACDPAKARCSIVHFPSDDAAADARPFILLVPGGGFANVWNLTEGWPVAQRFNTLGYHVFILTYQVGIDAAAALALDDIARALEVIARHRTEFRVDPARYITCGFSAGGYLVCLWNTDKGYPAHDLPQPQACFPVYPVTSFRLKAAAEWASDSAMDAYARARVGCTMQEACSSCFDIPTHAEAFPPTAIFVTAEDTLVDPEHSKLLARSLEQLGIPCRLEVGPTGGHGFADGEGMCMEGWQQRAISWYEHLKD